VPFFGQLTKLPILTESRRTEIEIKKRGALILSPCRLEALSLLLKVRQASRKLNKEYQPVNRILRTRQPAISPAVPKAGRDQKVTLDQSPALFAWPGQHALAVRKHSDTEPLHLRGHGLLFANRPALIGRRNRFGRISFGNPANGYCLPAGRVNLD
jgi:hypothetical protein